jgi:hypothetical protein
MWKYGRMEKGILNWYFIVFESEKKKKKKEREDKVQA